MSTTTTFSYDNSYRLKTQLNSSTGEQHSFTHDQLNRLTQITDGSPGTDAARTFAYNGWGERVFGKDGTTSPSYWAYDGRRPISENLAGSTTRYRWARNALVEFRAADGASFAYPALDNAASVRKLVGVSPVPTSSFEFTLVGAQLGANDTIGGSPPDRLRFLSADGTMRLKTTQETYVVGGGPAFLTVQQIATAPAKGPCPRSLIFYDRDVPYICGQGGGGGGAGIGGFYGGSMSSGGGGVGLAEGEGAGSVAGEGGEGSCAAPRPINPDGAQPTSEGTAPSGATPAGTGAATPPAPVNTPPDGGQVPQPVEAPPVQVAPDPALMPRLPFGGGGAMGTTTGPRRSTTTSGPQPSPDIGPGTAGRPSTQPSANTGQKTKDRPNDPHKFCCCEYTVDQLATGVAPGSHSGPRSLYFTVEVVRVYGVLIPQTSPLCQMQRCPPHDFEATMIENPIESKGSRPEFLNIPARPGRETGCKPASPCFLGEAIKPLRGWITTFDAGLDSAHKGLPQSFDW